VLDLSCRYGVIEIFPWTGLCEELIEESLVESEVVSKSIIGARDGSVVFDRTVSVFKFSGTLYAIVLEGRRTI